MRKTLALFAFLFIIISCKKNDDEPSSGSTQSTHHTSSSFTAYVNGVLTTADSAEGYLVIDTPFTIPWRGLLVAGYCPGKTIIPEFTDTINSYNLTTLNYDMNAGAGMDYYQANDTFNEYYYTDAAFEITSVDTVNKKVSGNFSGTVVGDVTGDTIEITNGSFTDVKYEIH